MYVVKHSMKIKTTVFERRFVEIDVNAILYPDTKWHEMKDLADEFDMEAILHESSLISVLRVRCLKTNTVYVVKMYGTNKSACVREASFLHHLSKNLHIVQATKCIHLPTGYGLVMEYVPHTLEELKVSTTIISQLAEALYHCHSHAVIHGDITPRNIVIDAQDNLKLIDFGHSQLYFPSLTYPVKIGTYGFQAPEIVFQSMHYTYAVDMWSVGCILLELLCRQRKVPNPWHSDVEAGYILLLCRKFGTSAIRSFCTKYGLKQRATTTQVYEAQTWTSFLNLQEPSLPETHLLDLIDKLMDLNPETRMTSQALRGVPPL